MLLSAALLCITTMGSYAQFSSQQATNLVLNQILAGERNEVDVFMMDSLLTTNDSVLLRNGQIINQCYPSSWVFFVDDTPFANWAHPCRYILVSSVDGSWQIFNKSFFPLDWDTDYSSVSQILRPVIPALPANTDVVIEPCEPNPHLYAVFIVGDDAERFWNDISAMYVTLIEVYGYIKENIYVHYVEGNSTQQHGNDLDDDEVSDFDYPAYKNDIENTFNELSGNKSTMDEITELEPDDQLFIYVDCHGEMSGGYHSICLPLENKVDPTGYDYIADYEMAEYIEDIECAQIIALFQPCYMGGFKTELSDYENYEVACSNRTIITASNNGPSYAEMSITNVKFNEFVFYWCAAVRGYYPLNDEPWEISYDVISFPFTDYYIGHEIEVNPDDNGDGYIQMKEAFEYANDFDTYSDYGFTYTSGGTETPLEFHDIYFEDDLLTLNGIAGQIMETQLIDEKRSYLAGGVLSVASDVSLVLDFDEAYFPNSSGISVLKDGELDVETDLWFGEKATFNIEPGGKVELDGAFLSNMEMDCDMWRGIEVWGISTDHQFMDTNGDYQQGYLEINNSTIENALVAVNLWDPFDYTTTGGILNTNGAEFINNVRAVNALHYKNFDPNTPSQEMPNQCAFLDSDFKITNNYSGIELFDKHISLFDVNGIKFQGCRFELDNSIAEISNYNSAISSANAGFSLEPYCASTSGSCPEMNLKECEFTGFYTAVNANGDGTGISPVTVYKTVFTDNSYGVRLQNMNNATILFSKFYLGGNTGCGVGIRTDNVTGFIIEENKFWKYTGAPIGDYFGVIINESKAVNEIYKNTFDGLSYGNFAGGQNRNLNNYEGLSYACNINTNNYADFYIANGSYGVQSIQGNSTIPAGNTFSQNNNAWHFYNGSTHLLEYLHANSPLEEIPQSNKSFYIAKQGCNSSNPCASNYIGTNSTEIILSSTEKLQLEQQYYNIIMYYNNTKTLYDSYVDGGDTEAELLDIQTAQPQDMWSLRAKLLGDSPHLSFEVLKEASDKTDVFTESALFDILAANPDELKKDTLISYLENKTDPLPGYMINLLKQIAEGTTYKTALQSQMSNYKMGYSQAAQKIIRSILNDTVINHTELRNWLDNIGGITSDYQIVSSYINEGNYTDAINLANMLPLLYDLSGEDLNQHNRYIELLTLYQTLAIQNRNIAELDSLELIQVQNIAGSGSGVAVSYAQSILEGVYGEVYNDCPQADGSAAHKSKRQFSSNKMANAYGLTISAKPNPASEWASFSYKIPGSSENGYIIIRDMNGIQVTIFEVAGGEGQQLWDTRNVKPGLYIYSIHAGDLIKSGKITVL